MSGKTGENERAVGFKYSAQKEPFKTKSKGLFTLSKFM
jgi:hypothetical protein